MKRATVFAILAILVLGTATVQAQMPVSFGLRGGMSMSNLSLDPEFVELDSRTSLAGGGFLVLDLPGILDIQVEALYMPKGATADVQITDESGEVTGTGELTYKLDYLEVPLLARVGLGTGPIHLLAGPALGFKVTSKATLDGFPDEELDWIKSTDLGLVVGLGAALPSSFGSVVIDARYNLGLNNLNDSDEGADFKNRTFLVSAGVAF